MKCQHRSQNIRCSVDGVSAAGPMTQVGVNANVLWRWDLERNCRGDPDWDARGAAEGRVTRTEARQEQTFEGHGE